MSLRVSLEMIVLDVIQTVKMWWIKRKTLICKNIMTKEAARGIRVKIREVYIGNGVTINPQENDEVNYYLDMDKLEKLVAEKGSVTVGAAEDWFFTAQDVNKEDLEKIKTYRKHILRSSCWAKFEVEIDGDRQDCTIEIPKQFDKLAYMHGFDDGVGKFHFWVRDAYWRIKGFPYEKIKKCAEEVDAVIKKYEVK